MSKARLIVAAALAFCGATAVHALAPSCKTTLSKLQVRVELRPVMAANPLMVLEDDTYGVANYEWVEQQLERFVRDTWSDRKYVPEVNDCDDFADDLRYQLRKAWRNTAPQGAGGAPIAINAVQSTVRGANSSWHAVVIVRTDRGWFYADPTKGWNSKTRKLDLLPLAQLNGFGHRVIF